MRTTSSDLLQLRLLHKSSLLRPSATTLGSVTVNKPRLFVRLLSFTLMEVGLVILALIAALLVFYTPRAFDLHDWGSISGIASVLAESPELCKLAKEKNSLTRSTFESELEKHTYNTRPESKRIGIEVSGPSTAIYRLARQDTPDQSASPLVATSGSKSHLATACHLGTIGLHYCARSALYCKQISWGTDRCLSFLLDTLRLDLLARSSYGMSSDHICVCRLLCEAAQSLRYYESITRTGVD